MVKLEVLNNEGKKLEEINLDTTVFDGKVNIPLMHQAVVCYLANQRKGLASTRTKGEVRGGGRKPWRQKGTGRARVGSIRSPLWRGGGVVFGPKPRDYYKKFPRRMKVMALKSALNAKFKDKEILVVEDIFSDAKKTKDVDKVLSALGLRKGKICLVVDRIMPQIKRVIRNIPGVILEKAAELNTYRVLDCSKLVFVTGSTLKAVEERIKKWVQ